MFPIIIAILTGTPCYQITRLSFQWRHNANDGVSNHRGPVNSPHKWSVTRKMFPFDDVIMVTFWILTCYNDENPTTFGYPTGRHFFCKNGRITILHLLLHLMCFITKKLCSAYFSGENYCTLTAKPIAYAFPKFGKNLCSHYSDVTMSAMASKIISISTVCYTVCSCAREGNTKACFWP